MVTISKFLDILQKSHLASIASRSPSEKVCNSAFFVQRVFPCALQRVLLPRGSSRLSGGVKFDVVRDLLVLENYLRKENLILPAISVDCNFFGQEACDVVPVRDDQVACPTSSRIQSVSDEYSRKHLCTERMMTTFVFCGDWINVHLRPNWNKWTIEWSVKAFFIR